ncbi:hypothetical protein EJ06DRAFT_529205 [Trichodelitschia bisporula]|uniref:Uncharacterized protein n=1 Tax=Trichodelitschia bisporula TaxID=703511 RepID=A0A6G1I1M8_9PEZI|nr:hypothetical protein EJ06DRAFT_529205 [Trichodelitschia bisporula]
MTSSVFERASPLVALLALTHYANAVEYAWDSRKKLPQLVDQTSARLPSQSSLVLTGLVSHIQMVPFPSEEAAPA